MLIRIPWNTSRTLGPTALKKLAILVDDFLDFAQSGRKVKVVVYWFQLYHFWSHCVNSRRSVEKIREVLILAFSDVFLVLKQSGHISGEEQTDAGSGWYVYSF